MTEPVNPFVTVSAGGVSTASDWTNWIPASSVTGSQPQGFQPAPPIPQPPLSPALQAAYDAMGLPMPFQPRDPDVYFEDPSHRSYFAMQRKNQMLKNAANRAGPPWTEQDELKLVDNLWVDWYGEHYHGTQWGFPDLNLDSLEAKPLRKNELKPFKIEYETYQEVKLRLVNTLIAIKGHPFYVTRAAPHPTGGFKLAITNGNDTYSVDYKDLTDLRSIPPMYVTTQHTGWLCRLPGRVYQQGLNRHNTVLKTIDGSASLSALDTNYFLKMFGKRSDRKWDETVASLIENQELSTLRLSDDVAVGSIKGKPVACYRGRALGKVQGNEVTVFDEDDLLQGWIEKSVQKVGLELRA